MKNRTKRFLSLLAILALLISLSPAVFADEEDYYSSDDDYYYSYEEEYEYSGDLSPEISVFIPTFELPMNVNDHTSVSAIVSDADSSARYDWYCSDPSVVSISGAKEKVNVTALKPGEAEVTLTVTSGDGLSSDFDFFYVTVASAASPITISGGGSVSLEAGETRTLNAYISGGSGNYDYEWYAAGDAALQIIRKSGGSADVHAGNAGSGWVTLTVYDTNDRQNNETVQWDFSVQAKPQAQPPVLEMSRGSVDLGPGASASLQLAVSGGSGSFEYIWNSDNSGIVAVTGHGNAADIRASSTLLPYANTAQISAHVRDTQTGLTSNTVTCLVTVSGGTASYNASGSTNVGSSMGMDPITNSIDSAFRSNFGSGINYSASVKFETTSSNVGSFRLQDDTMVVPGTNYAFASFQDMLFRAIGSGRFSTNYMIVDGGNTMYGSITIDVSGGTGVSSVTMNPTSMSMETYSSNFLSVSVAPANANYNVEWTVSNSLATIEGSGTRVSVKTSGNTGTATVTAIVTDINGVRKTCTCALSVYAPVVVVTHDNYSPSISITLGSDYNGKSLSDSISSRFNSVFGYYPGRNTELSFTSLGQSYVGTLRLRNGANVMANTIYHYPDLVDMYFVPAGTGTYSLPYKLDAGTQTMTGVISITVKSTAINATLNQSVLNMNPYSTQYISLNVSPSNAYYRVSWTSSNTAVATVSGNSATGVVTSASSGTTVITAIITDSNGAETRRSCTVVVGSSGSTFNPSVSTMLGVPYIGTGTSSAMRSQYQALYGTTLGDNAIIRFSSTGNTDVGIMRLADGSAIRPNTDYTLAQYVAMYTQPVSAGTYSVPYNLSYNGRTLNGTVSVVINAATISTDMTLPKRNAYWFSDPIENTTGGIILSDSIRNSVGTGWAYLLFGKSSDGTGTLYLDKNYTALTPSSSVAPSALGQLYFVPGNSTGVFSAPYTVYSSSGSVLATGTLNITIQGVGFSDVPSTAYYAPAVDWAVSRSITSGTGGQLFSPEMPVTRSQAVTFLWRAAGSPQPTLTVTPFTDVVPGSYYYDAVLWAVQQGITNGTSETTFGPDITLNRDQFLTFLCRASGGYAGGADWSALAVNWASARGLLSGVPGDFVANSICPRSDVAYYLWKNYNG